MPTLQNDNAGCDWAADPLRKVVSERMVNKSKDLDVEIVHQMTDLKIQYTD